ncbi:hypothetical protein FBY22_3713 [Streptomyces sp. SLBN-31]|nr:hypothetical protein FBY22_3713 [Streptomyces sp. SLBN-31]
MPLCESGTPHWKRRWMMNDQTRSQRPAHQPAVPQDAAPQIRHPYLSDERDKIAQCLGALRTIRIRATPRGGSGQRWEEG